MCIFCKIINKEIPTEIVYEDKDILAFKDANPIAPVHILIIPKRHIETINDLEERDNKLAGKMILAARDIAKKLGIAEDGYKLLFRVGKNGGQEVGHIHLHLIGGAKLYEEIRPE
jgi:histidine triad (HIT) family protein